MNIHSCHVIIMQIFASSILPLCGLLCSRDAEHVLTLGFWDWLAIAVFLIAALLTIPITVAEKMFTNASTYVE